TGQIEMGGTFQRESDGGRVGTWDAPEPLLRVGVLDRVEVRLSAEGWIGSHEQGHGLQNVGSDLVVSTKIRLFEPERWLPAPSLLAGIGFPTGGRSATSDGYDPFGTLLASWDLGERFSFTANLGIGAPTQGVNDPNRVCAVFAAGSLGVALSERVGA